jgi:uncharacterized protein
MRIIKVGEMLRKFSCITECSDCCIDREYYPSVEYGKVGVLILPHEKPKIEMHAKDMGLKVRILPRLGIGTNRREDGPETVIAYQLMGKSYDGNVCPFLDTESIERSPHGGFKCRIYNNKPLACSAYPVLVEEDKQSAILDSKCKFCRNGRSAKADKNSLEKEIQALKKIKEFVNVNEKVKVWRYATAIGEEEKENTFYPAGWILQDI